MRLGWFITLSINIAPESYIIVSLGPKALEYESFEGKGIFGVVGFRASGFYGMLWLKVKGSSCVTFFFRVGLSLRLHVLT